MAQSNLKKLDQILREERSCLRGGNFAGLNVVVAQKEAAILRAEGHRHGLSDLRRILTIAQENQRLILAAMQGLRAARARLNSIREADAGMTAYTSEGQALRLGVPLAQVEHRA